MLSNHATASEDPLVNGSSLYTIEDFRLLQRYALLDPDRAEAENAEQAAAIAFAHALALRALDEESCAADYADLASMYLQEACRLAAEYPELGDVYVAGYKAGVSLGSALCANNLGSLYYMGDLVEQDYSVAAGLYCLAAKWGCYQSLVNLGYIYEYGRCGSVDYNKAYQCYSMAAALDGSSEALYKMGDCFAHGYSVACDMDIAMRLWERSYVVGECCEEKSHPALRLAKQYLNPSTESIANEMDPLRALSLFQKAEIGLRVEVKSGLTYYRKQLEEAIAGQSEARARLAELEEQ